MLGAGPIVRISPNEYSIDDPDAARIMYRTRDELVKVRQYVYSFIYDIYEAADDC